MTVVNDQYFAGLTSIAPQLTLSVMTLQKAAKSYTRPQQIYTQAAAKSASYLVANEQLTLGLDIVQIPDFLTTKTGGYRRAMAWTPLYALDMGISRDATADFSGFHIIPDLMVVNGLESLEERTAYLIQAWQVRQSLIAEWNLFADLQQSLWLTILHEEGAEGIGTFGLPFEPNSGHNWNGVNQVNIRLPPWIRGVSRGDYETAITKWLLDSGTTARSGGAATTNDTYITWLVGLLTECPANLDLIPKYSIDARDVYRYPPPLGLSINSEGAEGVSGVADQGASDPADQGQSKALDLLEELADLGGGLTASIGSGANTPNIDTLPEC
jgi:hypothetical protein